MTHWTRVLHVPLLSAMALGGNGCGKADAPHGGMGGFPMSAVVARAEREVVENRVVVVATLASKDEVTLVSELDATVTEVPFAEGQVVNKGDVLFRLDEVRTRARLEEAEAGYRLAELSHERNKKLLENQTISQQEYDQAEATYHERKAALALARDEQANTVLAAPFDGVAGERQVSVGQYVSRGELLTRLISMDPLEIVFDVPERYAGQLHGALSVVFTADAYPDETFKGQVVYMSPSVEERTRTVRVKANVPNTAGRLKPGMFGELALVLSRRDDALVIPESCIRFMGDARMVVTVNGEGQAEFRPVQVGQRSRGRAEILEGLGEGEHVVVEGFQMMGPGMTVLAAPESAAYGVTPGPLGSPTAGTPESEEPVHENL